MISTDEGYAVLAGMLHRKPAHNEHRYIILSQSYSSIQDLWKTANHISVVQEIVLTFL